MVWVTFLNRSPFISLSRIANMMGAGKKKIRFIRLITTVLRIISQKLLLRKNFRKLAKPTNSLPNSPLKEL